MIVQVVDVDVHPLTIADAPTPQLKVVFRGTPVAVKVMFLFAGKVEEHTPVSEVAVL